MLVRKGENVRVAVKVTGYGRLENDAMVLDVGVPVRMIVELASCVMPPFAKADPVAFKKENPLGRAGVHV